MNHFRATIIATATVLFASILAGCGDDNKQSSSETTPTAQVQTPDAPIEETNQPDATPTEEMEPMDAPAMVEAAEEAGEQLMESATSVADSDLDATVQSASDEVTIAEEMEEVAEVTDGDAMIVIEPTTDQLRAIQTKLAAAGYNPGPADGIMGSKTLAALHQFQSESGLATGNITKQTLSALGVE